MSKEEIFRAFEAVRVAGKHNMLMDADAVMEEMGLDSGNENDRNAYCDVINNYSKYASMYL